MKPWPQWDYQEITRDWKHSRGSGKWGIWGREDVFHLDSQPIQMEVLSAYLQLELYLSPGLSIDLVSVTSMRRGDHCWAEFQGTRVFDSVDFAFHASVFHSISWFCTDMPEWSVVIFENIFLWWCFISYRKPISAMVWRYSCFYRRWHNYMVNDLKNNWLIYC